MTGAGEKWGSLDLACIRSDMYSSNIAVLAISNSNKFDAIARVGSEQKDAPTRHVSLLLETIRETRPIRGSGFKAIVPIWAFV